MKFSFLFLAISIALVSISPMGAFAQSSCDPAPAGLVSWWAAEGSAIDQISGNNGSLMGNAGYGPGKVGQAFVFDGNSGTGVALGNPTNLQLQNFTIEAWIKRASTTTVSAGAPDAWLFGYANNGYAFGLWNNGQLFLTKTGVDSVQGNTSITDTNFHHVAVTKVGSTVTFYVDGVGYPPVTYNTVFSFTTPAGLGYLPGSTDSVFLGLIDELSVYNRALSQSEIQSIYNAGGAGKCSTPVAPLITSQPTNQTVMVGQSATFRVSVSGTPPLSFQWTFNTTNIAGATNATFFLASAQLTNAGIYAVLVSNTVNSVLSSNAFLTVNPSPPCDPPAPGLVSWWAAEGNAYDQIGTNHGSLIGNATYGPGEVGQGFLLDGNPGTGVALGNPAGLQLQNFTIEAWIQRSSTTAVSANAPNAWLFGYNSNGYGFGLWNDGKLYLTKAGVDSISGSTSITDLNIHHVAVTKNGSTIIFYLDGVGYPPIVYNTVFSFTSSAGIGYLPGYAGCAFLGMIDEVSVYNRPLSASEIQGIYNAASGGKCSAPVAPVITSQPTNQTAFLGQPTSFSVTANGTLPLSYQWSFNTTNIVGATNATLLLPSAQLTNAGIYAVLVSNIVSSIPSSNAMLTVISPGCDPAPLGIVSWWAGEGNTFDQIRGYDGTLVGNATYGPGRVGQGFVFDGNSSGVQLSSSTGLQLQDLTIETWMKRATTSLVTYDGGGNAVIFGYGTGAYVFFITPAGDLIFSQQGNFNYVVGPAITDTNWHHVAVTKVGSTIVFYLDGVAYGAPPYNVTLTFAGGPPGIGFWGENHGDSFLGTLDELSIYNRALSQPEIQGIYLAGSGGKCPAPCVPHTATGTAVQTNGFVIGVNLASEGCGYTNTPAIHLVGGGGSGALASVVVSNGVVVAVNITNAGYGYTNAPQVVIDPPFVPTPVLGIAPMSFLTFSNVTVGGTYQLQQFKSYYWANLPLSFTATNITYTQFVAGLAGIGDYRLALSPAPAQAFATAQVINGFVVGATVTAGGSGYVTTPAINIVADAGSNAVAVASINGGVVTSINMINAGMGYTNQVTMQIDPPPAAAVYLSGAQPVMRMDSANLAPYYNYQVQFKPDINGTWANWDGGLFVPAYVTNSQYLFITNGSGYFRLQHGP